VVDVVVIGGGPVGENVADRVVKGGLSAVIVESRLLGGECSYYACVPSKALLRPASALEGARTVDGSRQAVTGALDPEAVLARRTRLTGDWTDDGQVDWLAEANIDLARGHGRLSGARTVTRRPARRGGGARRRHASPRGWSRVPPPRGPRSAAGGASCPWRRRRRARPGW